MAKEEIFCVGKKIPGYDNQYVPFNSNQSLLDADIIIFEPNFENMLRDLNIKPDDLHSNKLIVINRMRPFMLSWQTKLQEAFNAGKTIFIFLGQHKLVQCQLHHFSNYECLPINLLSIKVEAGKKMKLTNEGKLLASYWKAMRDISRYEMHYDARYLDYYPQSIFVIPLMMVTSSGDRCVASWIKGSSGHFILLPALDLENSDQGKALINCLVQIHKVLRSGTTRTPEPDWCKSKNFILEGEKKLICRIAEIEKETLKLKEEHDSSIQDLEKQTLPRVLLYKTGNILESAVIDAIETVGFKAKRYSKNELDFDIVFESAEGRCLGEVEGKDNKSIDINKFQQLERHISEDFARSEITEPAKGVLFGNPFRLIEPDNREQPFTNKVHQAAKRTGTALVHTPDMFPLVKYLKCKSDPSLAKHVREAIVETKGEMVKFPDVPDFE